MTIVRVLGLRLGELAGCYWRPIVSVAVMLAAVRTAMHSWPPEQGTAMLALQASMFAATGAAILLAPLVQVAWAEGTVTDRERAVVFEVAARRGIEPGSPPRAQLEAWLRERPPDAVFETALHVIEAGLAILTVEEQDQRRREIVTAAGRVAEASGGRLARLLGVHRAGSSGREAAVLRQIAAKLRGGTASV